MKKLYLIILATLFFIQSYGEIIRGRVCLPMEHIDAVPTNKENEHPVIIQDTGFYWVYVKSMPSWWTFWKRWKPVRIMAAYAKKSTREIIGDIDMGMPVFMTTNLEEVQSLKAELSPLGCTVKIYEVAFSFSSVEDAEHFKNKMAQRVIDK